MRNSLIVIIASLIAVLALLPGLCSAFTFSVEPAITAIQGGSTQLTLKIKSPIDDRFMISMIGRKPWMTISASNPSVLANEEKEVTVYLTPTYDTPTVVYAVGFIAQSLNTSEKQRKDVHITVKRADVAIIDRIVVSGSLEPTGQADISIKIKNYGSVTLHDYELNAMISSPTEKLDEIQKIIEKIEPDEIVEVNKTVLLPLNAEPGMYSIDAKIYQNGKMIDSEIMKFKVMEKAIIEKKEEKYLVLFGSGTKINITNIGNKVSDKIELQEEICGFRSLFFIGDKPERIENHTYTWIVNPLKPGESAIIKYQINYWWLVIIVLVIIAIAWFSVHKVWTLRIKKFIMQKKRIEEGVEFTVGIELKNESGKNVKNVVVRDFVPSIFRVTTTIMRPKVRKKETGTELLWQFKEFHPKEDRILRYKIRAAMGVSGQMRLPSASVKFKIDEKTRHNRSHRISLGLKKV